MVLITHCVSAEARRHHSKDCDAIMIHPEKQVAEQGVLQVMRWRADGCDSRQSSGVCSSPRQDHLLHGPSAERRLSEVLGSLPLYKDREDHLHHCGNWTQQPMMQLWILLLFKKTKTKQNTKENTPNPQVHNRNKVYNDNQTKHLRHNSAC